MWSFLLQTPHTITMYKTGSEMTYVPLRTLSNAVKADLHVSFHYNALAGKWNYKQINRYIINNPFDLGMGQIV